MDILSAKEAFDLSTIDRNEETQREFEKLMISIAKATQKGAYDLRVYHIQEENQQKLRDLGFIITEKKPSTKSFTFYEIEWDEPDDPFFDGEDQNPDDSNNPTNPDEGKDPSKPDGENPTPPSSGDENNSTGNGDDNLANKGDIDNLFPGDKNNTGVTP